MTAPFTTQTLQDALTAKLALNFGTEPGEATDQEMLKACALVLRDVMTLRGIQTAREIRREGKKQVHYLSLEFLMGRSLMKNAYNLGVLPRWGIWASRPVTSSNWSRTQDLATAALAVWPPAIWIP